MALPWFLGDFILGTSCVHGKNSDDSGLHFTIAPAMPDSYNAFGPLRPIYVKPSQALITI